MAWTRWDDHMDEELAYLSDRAFRLYTTAVTYSRRLGRGGRLHVERDVRVLAAAQRIRGIGQAIAELLTETDDDPALWVRDGDYIVIRSYAKFNPPTSAERTREWRVRQRHQARNGGDVTSQPVTENVTPRHGDADSRARTRAGSPVPIPIPSPTYGVCEQSETTAHAREGVGTERGRELPVVTMPGYAVSARRPAPADPWSDRSDTPLLSSVQQAYLEAGRKAGLGDGVLHRALGQIDAAAREFGAGVPEEVLIEAARRNATKPNAAPQRLDVEIREVQLRAQTEPTAASIEAAARASWNRRQARLAAEGAS